MKKQIAVVISSLALILGCGAAIITHTKNEVFTPTFASYTNGDAATYYNSIDSSKSGNDLLKDLRSLNLSKRKSTVGYSSMGTSPSGQFKYTDYDPNYVQYDSNGQPYGTRISSFYTYTSATSWNREHVWPNSHGGGSGGDAGSPYPDADIHMPRPTISSENSSRGNSFFVEGMNHSSSGWDPYTAGYNEQSRGEAARITFYCTLVNSKLILAPNNTSPSGTDSVTGQSFGSGHTMGNLETLIRWNINYPVTQREKNRNEGAEYLQGNRNAFVDHPEYACKIWGNVNNTIKNLCANASWDVGPSVSISRSAASITVDDTTMINATASDNSTITWSSSDTTVVTVSSASAASGANITLTGIGPGTATITAKATINSTVYSATCSVTVSTSGGGGGSGGDDTPSDGYTITNTDAPSAYPTSAKSYTTASGLSFTAYNVMNQSSKIQFKKGGGYLYNNNPLSLGTLNISGTSGTLTVCAGTTKNPSTTITGSNGTYNLKSYSYFKIINNSGSVASCSSISVGIAQESPKTLSSICVSTAPTKTTYTAGEIFDPTGLVITRNYSDSTSDTYTYAGHTNDFSFNPSTALKTTDTSVTITYGGKSCNQSITVNAASVKTLSSITVTNPIIAFTVGDTFDFGGTVTANYSDSTSEDVTSSAEFSGYNMSVAGNYTITVSFTDSGTTKTANYQITVSSSGGGSQESDSFSKTYSYDDLSEWSVSNSTNPSGYILCPDTSNTTSVALFPGIFTNKTITSNVVITINCATYGSGQNPTASTFTVYNSEACASQVSSAQTGTLPSSSTYTNAIYTVSLSNATASFVDDLAIKITKPGKQIRIKTITIEFDYSVSGSVAPTSISAIANKTFYVGETITKSDITVKDNNNATITTFDFDSYQFTYSDAASGGALTSKTFENAVTYETLSCSLAVQVQRKAYTAPSTSSTTYAASSFSGLEWSYTENQTITVNGMSFTVNGYYYNKDSKLSLSDSKTSARGSVINNVAYSTGITNVTVNGASPDIQYSVDGDKWVDKASADTTATNYYFFKLFYKNTTQTNYVNISSIVVYTKGAETPENVANYIMYEDTNNQCTSKFATAKYYFENMTTSGRSTFMTSDDYVISTARERLEAWARNLGKTITLVNGDYVISSNRFSSAFDMCNPVYIIGIVATLVSGGFVGLYFLLRKKKHQ